MAYLDEIVLRELTALTPAPCTYEISWGVNKPDSPTTCDWKWHYPTECSIKQMKKI